MARRRRAFSSCYCFSASFSSVVVCFQERTSCPFLNFAQSRRRRFTESFFGVSLCVSDAEPSRTRSLPPTAFVRSSFEPSDLASNRESLELVAGVHRASQIWISDPTSVILMPLIVRDPSMLNRRTVSSPSCFSDSDRSAPHHLPSPAAFTDLLSGRLSLHPLSAVQTLELKVLGQFWVLQIMGRVLVMGLLGLIDQKHVFISPQPNILSFLRRCCSSHKPSPSAFISLISHPLAPQEVLSAFSLNCLSGSKSISFNLRVKSQKTMESAISSLLHWRLLAEHLFHLGVLELPRYQNSSCRGQERSSSSSSFLKERTLSHVSSSALVWFLYRCLCVARSTLVCEGCGSETSVSVIFKGSSIWCFVTFDSVAEFWIGFSALGAESISNNGSFLMLVVSHGSSSLPASNVVKVRRRREDIYCLKIEFACIYQYRLIYCFYVFCLGFVAALLLNLVNLSVTILSFDGE